ncbi:MAG: hypothetical protein V3S69_00510 [Dehalococcoidales bacterium]
MRVYSAVFDAVSVSAIQDLFNLLAGTNNSVVLISVSLFQETQTSSELLQIKYQRIAGAGTGGSAPTPRPRDPGLAAADASCRANDTTQGTPGNVDHIDGWNVVNPYLYLPVPEERITVPGAGRIAVELETAPIAAMTMSGTIVWGELG